MQHRLIYQIPIYFTTVFLVAFGWLVWTEERTMSLEEIWHQYLKRFGVEHSYRSAKQRLHWTMPSLKTPEQCEKSFPVEPQSLNVLLGLVIR